MYHYIRRVPTLQHQCRQQLFTPDVDLMLGEMLGIQPRRLFSWRGPGVLQRSQSCPSSQRGRSCQLFIPVRGVATDGCRVLQRGWCGGMRKHEGPTYNQRKGLHQASAAQAMQKPDQKNTYADESTVAAKSTESWQEMLRMPGFTPEDVTISVNPDTRHVHIHAAQKSHSDTQGYQSYYQRQMQRVFLLPENISTDDITAKYDAETGLLTLHDAKTVVTKEGLTKEQNQAVDLKINKEKKSDEGVVGAQRQSNRPVYIRFNPWTGRMVMYRRRAEPEKTQDTKQIKKDKLKSETYEVQTIKETVEMSKEHTQKEEKVQESQDSVETHSTEYAESEGTAVNETKEMKASVDDKHYSLELNTSGFAPESIKVAIEGNTVTVTAKQEVQEDDVTITRAFSRTQTLPPGVDVGQLQCHLEGKTGKLQLIAPKHCSEKRNIEIKMQSE